MNFRKVLALSLLAPALLMPGASALNNRRHSHTATLLPDGNILIVGGAVNTATATNSVEMYDMASNTYINWAGGLVTARSSHTATLMSDGRVLIAGGFGSAGQPMVSLEICNPAVRTCAAAGVSLATARGGHTATLLSKGPRAGQVLLCGGHTTGASATLVTESCETFNPSGPSVLAAGPMVSPREGHAAVLLYSGRVFVTGGRRRDLADSAWIYEPMNEMYDPEANAGAGVWTPVSALLQGRVNHTATVLNNGKIMIAGGYNDVNALYCKADENSLEDECWNIKYDPLNTLGAGTQGYIDGAEFFDQNGARVVLSEQTYGEMPYRVAQHTAALLQDGRWKLQGGYGNIYPTFFTNAPKLTSDSVVYLTPTGNHTATIDTTSFIKFPLAFSLSRPVSGRLVNSDAFISGPPPNSASVEMDTVKFYLPASVAPADGSPVGLLLGEDFKPGDFNDTLQLQNPSGSAVFSKQTVRSGDSPGLTSVVTSTITKAAPLYPDEKIKPVSGSILAWVRLTVPNTYRRISGVANVISGQITDNAEVFSISLEQNGGGTFDVPAPTTCDTEAKTCVFVTTINFTGLSGQISNLTTLADGTTVYFPLETAGDQITLSLELDYTAREVYILDREPTYNFTRSTMVVRGMVFSSQLGYAPDSNTWGDLTNKKESPAMFTPSFNHTALLTPAADTVILGGRNCEFNPDADCLRTAMRFSTATINTIYIPVYRNSTGQDAWPAGEKLNSKRAFHTSTLLPDGSILTCGGSDGARPLATCELMDPQTKKWAATGAMNSPRANHTATLLPNGNVLAAGGVTPSGIAVNSAEIYYRDIQRWVPTASMAEARQLHTATLMPDGNVLAIGGATSSTYSATAEIYISSSAYWLGAGSMTNGRSQHTATLLKNGNVLVAGGINGLGAMRGTEIYNYLNRTFSAGPNLNTPRYAHTANQLRDGNVVVIGGSDHTDSVRSCEIYSGAAWIATADLHYNRANHRSTLLPNGKIMLTGGEMSGTAQSVPESFDPDYRSWSKQGQASGRTLHTSVLTRDNLLINIGGWSGGSYLDSTEYAHFNFYPDMNGLQAETTRQAVISSGTDYFNQGSTITLLSGTSNFHGITEASGGGAGAANASFHNPRVYIQQIDNPSGFMVDLSTRIYSLYGGPNTAWEKTLSSITIITPDLPGVMPHGWYHMRVAATGVFSDGYIVQVTVPRPTGSPSAPTGSVLGTSSITWTWTKGTVVAADGYSLYSSSDGVFITTAAFLDPASFTQAGLLPNTAVSVKVNAYNLGGSGPLSQSATYYTLAAAPTALAVTAASFETASLSWNSNNAQGTPYEVSMCAGSDFADPLAISTPVPFSVSYTSTFTKIDQLSANQMYYFRVRAMNGDGLTTLFSNSASTITVGSVNNLTGTAVSSAAISWSWDESAGADLYEVYDVSAGTATPVLVGSTTLNYFMEQGLTANYPYKVSVTAVKLNPGFGPVRGPLAYSGFVYTLTVPPLPATPNTFTNVSTGSLTVNWITNGNSTWTVYSVQISTSSGYGAITAAISTLGDRANFSGLAPNTRYYARVSAINGDGIASATLSLGSKYTRARAPAGVTPSVISMSGVLLDWDANSNPAWTSYAVRGTTDTVTGSYTTYVSFSRLYTDTSLPISGLLTATTYYFDVAARNGEGYETARIQSVPAAYTLPGPNGAPSGSIGGTSSPTGQVAIQGTLPDGRTVTLTIPAGSFPAATAIAISSSSTNACGAYAINGRTVEVALYSENNAQPEVPVTLQLSYDGNISPGSDVYKLVLARYNPVSGQCLPLETKIDIGPKTITATLNHFSVFQLMLRNAASNLNDVLVYPNPFKANRGHGFVTIANMPAGAKVRIYTLSGDKVWEGAAATTGIIIWRGVNASDELVASGVYLAVVDSGAGKKILKLAVER